MKLKVFTIETDSKQLLDRFTKRVRKALGWWRFWDRFIVLPKGSVTLEIIK